MLMVEEKPCVLLDWEDIYSLTKSVSEDVKDSGWQPDVIIGIARGAWVPSRIFCDMLGVTELLSIKVSHWGVTATPDQNARVKYSVNEDLSGKDVLIVDDISDTGETFKVAVKDVEDQNPDEVRTATLQNIKGSDFKPNYYSEEIDWAWIVYPWNFVEDMINLTSEVLEEEPKTTNDILNDFDEYFDIKVSKDRLVYSLEEGIRRNKIKKEDELWAAVSE